MRGSSAPGISWRSRAGDLASITLGHAFAKDLATAIAWLCPGSLLAMKGAILSADNATLFLLLPLLKHLHANRTWMLLYTWNALVLVELEISGHLDGLMISFAPLAFLWTFRKRAECAGVALGTATLVQRYPALSLPVLFRKRTWSLPAIWIAGVAAGYRLFGEAR